MLIPIVKTALFYLQNSDSYKALKFSLITITLIKKSKGTKCVSLYVVHMRTKCQQPRGNDKKSSLKKKRR